MSDDVIETIQDRLDRLEEKVFSEPYIRSGFCRVGSDTGPMQWGSYQGGIQKAMQRREAEASVNLDKGHDETHMADSDKCYCILNAAKYLRHLYETYQGESDLLGAASILEKFAESEECKCTRQSSREASDE